MSISTSSAAFVPFEGQQPVTLCDGAHQWPVDFTSTDCRTVLLKDVDPQGKTLWVEIPVNLSEQQLQALTPPLALFLYAKASSRAYFNDVLLGENGKPGNKVTEIPGAMDSHFYLPEGLLKMGKNRLVLHLSAQQGWLTLTRPLHFIGIGGFADPRQHLQQYSELGLVLLGVLLTGLVYFSVRSITPSQRSNHLLLVLMCLFSAVQLFAEMSRGLLGYAYPIHDIRLLTITLMSLGFGVCLLVFIAGQFARHHALHWIYAGILVTLGALWLLDSFDARTTAATFFPAFFAAIITVRFWWRTRSDQGGFSALALSLFILCMILTADYFHETLYFVFVSLLLGYLFIQQALESNRQELRQQQDNERIARLSFRLEQGQQQARPALLTLKSAGKIDKLNTAEIAYCQAAKDYSEIHLLNGQQHLYSGTLKSLEAELPSTFLRVHRSFLVNLEQIRRLSSATPDSTNASLILSNGQTVPVSRRLVPAVRSAVADKPDFGAD
ncbi:LytR/AlgR family response regulator transcription factor [Lacimicrobium alkaliphilum]|uniref:LytR/AlgR family response regulator transcription factor n=1 Tax=Lacimicrobium alkaliphilum TaxID=1526571 RepID=UPI0018D26963|nr:LytTR family DNA-binding domain-containing protein [Lacimicrobium alkaliphilum]